MDAIERGFRFVGSIVGASLAAGPIFCFSAALLSLSSSPGVEALLELFWVAIVTIPYGALFAFLPNLIGTAIMTALGAWFPMTRSFLAWIGAGAVGGLLFSMIFAVALLEQFQLVSVMILTGMACAAICRAFTRWPDADDEAQA